LDHTGGDIGTEVVIHLADKSPSITGRTDSSER
jgi:hypothetical protein